MIPETELQPLESASKERLRLWLRLLKASRVIESELRENLRVEFASTLPRFDVLSALARFEAGLKMSHLSKELKVSNGNVTVVVDRLSEDGFLVRVPVPGDRRASLVRLTKKGREEFQRQADAHEGWVNDILGTFDQTEARDICQQLENLSSKLTERGEK